MTRRALPASAAFVFAISTCSLALAQPMPGDKASAPAAAPRAAPRAVPAGARQAAGVAAKPGGEAAPSTEEIRQLVTDGKHREALQKLSRALALKGDAATQYDRHALLRMKAEAHLAIKDTAAAASAFAAAAKEASDDTARAEDKASELVVKRSKNLQFTPKPGKKGEKAEPIDIADAEKRKAAFAALLEEHKAAVAPSVKSAKSSKALPPIVEALKQIGDLRMLELAATGADAEASAMVEELAGSAHKLMDNAVQDMNALVNDIEDSANMIQQTGTVGHSPASGKPMLYPSARKRGLTTRDTQDLKRTIADLKKLVPMARDLGKSLGDQGKQFDKVADDGETVGNRAQTVLTTDYANDNMRGEGLRRPMEVKRK